MWIWRSAHHNLFATFCQLKATFVDFCQLKATFINLRQSAESPRDQMSIIAGTRDHLRQSAESPRDQMSIIAGTRDHLRQSAESPRDHETSECEHLVLYLQNILVITKHLSVNILFRICRISRLVTVLF
jgi:hypothetical protein